MPRPVGPHTMEEPLALEPHPTKSDLSEKCWERFDQAQIHFLGSDVLFSLPFPIMGD